MNTVAYCNHILLFFPCIVRVIVGPGILNMDTEQLFEKYTIEEIRKVERETRLDHDLMSVVAQRSSLPDSSSGVSSRMWVRIPAVTLVSLSKTLNHNCFSPPRG